MAPKSNILAALCAASVASATLFDWSILDQLPFDFTHESHPAIQSITQDQWDSLNFTVDGRLLRVAPVSSPCFSNRDGNAVQPDPAACSVVQEGYVQDGFRAGQIGSAQNTNWETCQAADEQCLLDFKDPKNPKAIDGQVCAQGSVAPYFIDVRGPKDAAAGFAFSRKTGVPISIRNSGHDWKGRSLLKNSLGLFVHNIQHIYTNPNFVPDGCPATKSYRGVTIGAGLNFGAVYRYAEANNITIAGGASQTVTHTGWVSGGGHGALTNTYGLGVDRVLQFKIVTTDGRYLTANACQNTDLFWAMRGGGASTFGLIIESTTQYEPQVEVQVSEVLFAGTDRKNVEEFLRIVIANSIRWAEEGWGGYHLIDTFGGSLLTMMTPKLSLADAKKSMKEITDWGTKIGAVKVDVRTENSFFGFFSSTFLGLTASEVAGAPVTLSSRLVPKKNFTPEKQAELLKKVLEGLDIAASSGPSNFGPTLQILPTTPYNNPPDASTSVTPAWEGAIWHLVYGSAWDWNSTATERKDAYARVSKAVTPLRGITPPGAYISEADVYEPNHEITFWGKNYARLLRVKEKYDPHHILDCWHCVGWKGAKDARYKCYH